MKYGDSDVMNKAIKTAMPDFVVAVAQKLTHEELEPYKQIIQKTFGEPIEDLILKKQDELLYRIRKGDGTIVAELTAPNEKNKSTATITIEHLLEADKIHHDINKNTPFTGSHSILEVLKERANPEVQEAYEESLKNRHTREVEIRRSLRNDIRKI